MAGFTIEYDGEGNAIGTTTREQELHDIFSRDGSFGFGDREYEQANMSANTAVRSATARSRKRPASRILAVPVPFSLP